jgi:hypothetical protein
MKRPTYRARIRWHRWMPWYEASRQIGEWQAHNDEGAGALTAGVGLAASVLIGALLVPALALPLAIVGGLLLACLLVYRSEDGSRLVAGLRAEGLPSPHTILRLGAQLVAEDARALWDGRPALAVDVAPLPLLLEGEIVEEDAERGEIDP